MATALKTEEQEPHSGEEQADQCPAARDEFDRAAFVRRCHERNASIELLERPDVVSEHFRQFRQMLNYYDDPTPQHILESSYLRRFRS